MIRDQYRGFRIVLHSDPDCENPVDPESGGPTITYNKGARNILGNTPVDSDEYRRVREKIARGEYIGMPVYAYVHSGVALRHYPFTDIDPQGWDSGHSGFIYLPRDVIRAQFGAKRISPKLNANVRQRLKSELAEFARWLTGDCWSYDIFDETGEAVDSLSGLVGHDYAMGSAKEQVDHVLAARAARAEADAVIAGEDD